MIKKRNSIDFSIDENYGYKSSKIVIEELQDDSDNEGTRKHEYFCRKIEHIIENKNENKSTFQFNKFTLTPRFLEIDYQDERQYAKGHEF